MMTMIERSAVRVWPSQPQSESDPRCDACGDEAAWWIDGVEVNLCDACLLTLLRVLAQEERVLMTFWRP